MNLIALAGFAGSGKDSAGRFLVDNLGFQSFSFAESLKDAVASIFCWDRALLSGDTVDGRAWREEIDPWWSAKLGVPHLTPRWVMQNFGTNVMREHFDQNIWIYNIERKLSLLPSNTNVVLSDSRFPNEFALARQFGGKIVRIKRGDDPEWFPVAMKANGFVELPDDETHNRQLITSISRALMEEKFKIHESEWAWIGQPLDNTVENNSTLEELHCNILKISKD